MTHCIHLLLSVTRVDVRFLVCMAGSNTYYVSVVSCCCVPSLFTGLLLLRFFRVINVPLSTLLDQPYPHGGPYIGKREVVLVSRWLWTRYSNFPVNDLFDQIRKYMYLFAEEVPC